MTTPVLPVTDVINVTITNTASGLITPNINSILLLTDEVPDNIDSYDIYVSPAQVAADYGSSSVTAQMANNIFAQVPNLLTGSGQLIIAPFQGTTVSATAGNFVTPNISANLSNLIAVTNGNLAVTLNGATLNLGALDLSNCLSLADVAQVLQSKLPNVIVTANATTITFLSKKVGSTSAVTLGTYAGGGTDISGAGYLHQATGTPTAGTNSSGETIINAINRMIPQVGFVGVITNLDIEDAVVESTASAVQALDLLFLHHFASIEDIAGIGTTVKTASQMKTRCLLYTPSLAAANLMKAAYVGRAFSTDFTGSNTSETLNLKSLANVVPDPGITQTNWVNANTAGMDMYVSYAGVPSVVSTGGNDFFDNQYCNLSLKFDLEKAGFNYLRQTNTKVPQTEPGMEGLKSAYSSVLDQYIRNASIAPGAWDSSEFFGDPAVFKQNILTTGYYVFSEPIVNQNPTDRQARKAPLIQIAIKRAGAIHSSSVLVIVNN